MTSEEKLSEFGELALQCLSGPEGTSGQGQMRIREATYDPKEGVDFGSVKMAPDNPSDNFRVNIIGLVELFDEVLSCEVATHLLTKPEEYFKTPHLRMMGMFKGITLMFDLHLNPADLDNC